MCSRVCFWNPIKFDCFSKHAARYQMCIRHLVDSVVICPYLSVL